VTGVTVLLFSPCPQQWPEQFLLDRTTGMIYGSTPLGRVTVETLDLNARHALATRRLLIRLGRIA
jgi:hypothetical protein